MSKDKDTSKKLNGPVTVFDAPVEIPPMNTNKQATEVRTMTGEPGTLIDQAPRMPQHPAPPRTARMPAEYATWRAPEHMLETDLAERFAVALLANGRIDQILGADPLSPGRVGDSKNGGEHLARQTHRLARQYLETLKQLTAGE